MSPWASSMLFRPKRKAQEKSVSPTLSDCHNGTCLPEARGINSNEVVFLIALVSSRLRLRLRLRHPNPTEIPHFPAISSPPLPAPMAPRARWKNLHSEALHRIYRHVPCKLDRVRMLLVCRAWGASLRHPPPLPPQLPWLLVPSPGGPTFSCLLSGANELSIHRVGVPTDLRSARYFGSYDGGWLFLAQRRNSGNMLLNLRTGRRIPIPDVFRSPQGMDCSMIMLAATVSSPPSDTDDPCFGAAIIHSSPNKYGRRQITFWLMGSQTAMASITPDPRFTRSRFFRDQEMEDVMYDTGDFYFLSTSQNILVCKPTLHQGALRVREEWRRFIPQQNPRPTTARYLVQSREQLLMVVKSRDILLPGLGDPTVLPIPGERTSWVFSVFQMSPDPPAHDGVGGPGYPWAWKPVRTLPGRMLFVGRGCSRSYEVAAFPGFQEGIYFLDDEDLYDVPRIVDGRRFLCLNNGKWSAGRPPVVSRCFWPDDQGMLSNYSSPVWLLPMGEDTDSDSDSDSDSY